jgi:hypothetical protein
MRRAIPASLPLLLLLVACAPLGASASFGSRNLRRDPQDSESGRHHSLGKEGHRWPAPHQSHHSSAAEGAGANLPAPSRGIDDDDNGAGSLTMAVVVGQNSLGYALQDGAMDVANAVLPGSATPATVAALLNPVSVSANTDCTAPAPGLTKFVSVRAWRVWGLSYPEGALGRRYWGVAARLVRFSVFRCILRTQLRSISLPSSPHCTHKGISGSQQWGIGCGAHGSCGVESHVCCKEIGFIRGRGHAPFDLLGVELGAQRGHAPLT